MILFYNRPVDDLQVRLIYIVRLIKVLDMILPIVRNPSETYGLAAIR